MAEIKIFVAPNPGPFTLDGSRSYLVNGEILIDPGPAIQSHIDAMAAAAPRLRAIFVTHGHGDHASAAAPLKEETAAAVIAPPGVLDGVAEDSFTDGAFWKFGPVRFEVLATPGHTPEHFCFLTDEDDLFTGDTILGEGTTVIAPPEGNMRAYMDSLQKIRARRPKRIYPGHGPVREDALAWIEHYIEHRRSREAQILALLGRRARTLGELRSAIYSDLDPRLHGAAELQITAHLEDLLGRTKVVRSGERYSVRE